MKKIMDFVRLEYIIVKPDIKARSLIMYAVMAFVLVHFTENFYPIMLIAMMFCLTVISHLFSAAEKNNLDTLYITLSVSRKTAVAGGYIFALLAYLCSALACSLLISAVSLLPRFGTGGSGILQTLGMAAPITLISMLIIAVDLPFYFRFGYNKAMMYTLMVPVAIMIIIYLVTWAVTGNPGIGSDTAMLTESVQDIPFAPSLVLAMWSFTAAISAVLLWLSYRLSYRFYRKREF